MTPALTSFVEHYTRRVNQQLVQNLSPAPTGGEHLLAAMRYSLLNGGKRIRPVLTYASAEAIGSIGILTDRAACALECVHAYSLIHDDLPAMDDDDLRRGEATCHIAFDEATAILAGDALQSLAFEILAEAAPGADQDAELILTLVRELGHAAGATGMVAGQAIDLAAVSQQLTLEQLEHMHRHKTGALIEASVVMGALSGGLPTEQQLRALRNYAQAIGLAFQVQDDILDVTVETGLLGKRQGADRERNKPTYVALLGLDHARRKARELHDQALQALETFDSRADHLRDLASYIIERGA
jgi:geranylgeranyl diphosphate synthase type II